jgi:hypothetical protein
VRRPSVVESEFCPDAGGVFPDNEVVYLDAKRLPDNETRLSGPAYLPTELGSLLFLAESFVIMRLILVVVRHRREPENHAAIAERYA